MPEGHIDNIKARADSTGEQLAYSNMQHHSALQRTAVKQAVQSLDESHVPLTQGANQLAQTPSHLTPGHLRHKNGLLLCDQK